MDEIKCFLNIKINESSIFIGHITTLLSPFIIVTTDIEKKLFKYLVKSIPVISGFLFNDREIELKDLSDLLRILNYISQSPIPSYTFILGIATKDWTEHTRPDIVGMIHRTLKNPIIRVNKEKLEYNCENCINIVYEEREQQYYSLELKLLFMILLPSLLTATTRRGGELRQVFAQTFLALYYLTRKDGKMFSISSRILDYLDILITNTYTYYAKALGRVNDLKAGEIRYLATFLRGICNFKDIVEVIRTKNVGNIDFKNWLNLIKRELNSKNIRNEFLLGRLLFLADKLERLKNDPSFNTVVTIATGQWGIGQSLLIQELLSRDPPHKILVLYTQNTLEQRLLEEYLRQKTKDYFNVLRDTEITYIPISAIDGRVIKDIIKLIVDRYINDDTLVIAQGAASISLYLYYKAMQKTSHVILT